ncbi:hypothetical protein LPB67_18135 [Undibacterium sp. Jales W-56]|uniref:hypothetical protein n=1 Tax=Undibacterium sp. Jales W-56 TaxID=2897325 RepID=UPI0021D1FF1E|nr:hypothetical protein [Undibacterium sp. Jales W-56]MCU6435701.1 hypothetical protein [Undibacterium sp. Jales W-56]
MTKRSEVLTYVIQEFYSGKIENAADRSGYTKNQINQWLHGTREPRKSTIEYLIQCAFVPEFKVIVEFAEFDSGKAIQTQLKSMLGEHANDPGIYAFYDSMGNLIYLGKATKLVPEIFSAINRSVHIAFPKGIKSAPKFRTKIVKYISAYDVGAVKWNDFPKHVESLILRISKPILNKNIGNLAIALKAPKDA